MKRDWQEKRVKQLFHELGREDERKAPGFANVLHAALMRRGVAHPRLSLWRLAVVAVIPVLTVVVALLLLASHSAEPAPPGDFTTLVPLPGRVPYRETGPGIMPPPIVDVVRPRRTLLITQSRRQRPASPTNNSSILISKWQSPTDCLLRVPGNELLKSLPRVPDSSPGILRGLIENHN